jgi:hypothetical protein
MINRFPSLLLHTTSIHHNDILLPQVIQSKDFPRGCSPHKERHSQKSLNFPDTLPMRRGTWITHDSKTSLQTFSSWKGSNNFYHHLLALLRGNKTAPRRKRPLPTPITPNKQNIRNSGGAFTYIAPLLTKQINAKTVLGINSKHKTSIHSPLSTSQ